MKRWLRGTIGAASLMALASGTALGQTVSTNIYTDYMSIRGEPVVLTAPATLVRDGDTVYIQLPGATLSSSSGAFYNKFLSFTLALSSADLYAFLF